jgi:hypothetical protein
MTKYVFANPYVRCILASIDKKIMRIISYFVKVNSKFFQVSRKELGVHTM